MYSPTTATASCLRRVLRAAALMSPAVCSPQLKRKCAEVQAA